MRAQSLRMLIKREMARSAGVLVHQVDGFTVRLSLNLDHLAFHRAVHMPNSAERGSRASG
jgi:hypothetical protein